MAAPAVRLFDSTTWFYQADPTPLEVVRKIRDIDARAITRETANEYVRTVILQSMRYSYPLPVVGLQRLSALVCRAAKPILDQADQDMVERLRQMVKVFPVLRRALESTLQKTPGPVELNPALIRPDFWDGRNYILPQKRWGVDLLDQLSRCRNPEERDAFLEAVQVASEDSLNSLTDSPMNGNADLFIKQALCSGSEAARWLIPSLIRIRWLVKPVVSVMVQRIGSSLLADIFKATDTGHPQLFRTHIEARGNLDSQVVILNMILAGACKYENFQLADLRKHLKVSFERTDKDSEIARRVAQSFVAAWSKRETKKAVGAWAVGAAFVKCALALTPLFWLAVGGFAYWGFKLWQKPQVPCANEKQRAEYEKFIMDTAREVR